MRQSLFPLPNKVIRSLTMENGQRFEWILTVSLLITAIASSSNVAPSRFGDVLVLCAFSVLFFYYLTQDKPLIKPTWAFWSVFIIYVMFVLNLFRWTFGHITLPPGLEIASQIPLTSATVGVFIVTSFLSLFVFPNIVPKETFMWVLSIVTGTVVVLGIPSLIIGPYTILGVEFAPYTTILPFREFGIEIPAMTSFYGDSNAVSKIALFGTFASLWVHQKCQNSLTRILLGLNGFGLYMGNSRGAILAALAGISIYFAIEKRKFGLGRVFFLGGLMISGYVILIFSGVLRGLPLGGVYTSGRGVLWEATIEMIGLNPLLGSGAENLGAKIEPFVDVERWQGLQPQNSYLRMFLSTGGVGGVAYLILVIKTIYDALGQRSRGADSVLIGFGVAVFVIQLFENVPIFGVNQSAVVIAIVLGYLLNELAKKSSHSQISIDNSSIGS